MIVKPETVKRWREEARQHRLAHPLNQPKIRKRPAAQTGWKKKRDSCYREEFAAEDAQAEREFWEHERDMYYAREREEEARAREEEEIERERDFIEMERERLENEIRDLYESR